MKEVFRNVINEQFELFLKEDVGMSFNKTIYIGTYNTDGSPKDVYKFDPLDSLEFRDVPAHKRNNIKFDEAGVVYAVSRVVTNGQKIEDSRGLSDKSIKTQEDLKAILKDINSGFRVMPESVLTQVK